VKHAHVLLEAGKLILFITPSVNVEQVKQALSSSLPSYMVPHYIFPLDEFPLNKNRKLDLAELSQYAKKAMETSSVDSNMISSRDSPSFSRVEEAISFIWAQHLQTPVVNMKRDSNFFELGGTSLSAVMVARALESEFGSEVGVTDVFVHQTIASLAEYLSKSTDAARYCGDPKPLHFLPGGRKELHPTLFSILQGFGLVLMSIIATVPLIGIAFLSIRSFIWFGNAGVFIFPGILCGGCLLHLALVSSCKWLVIGQFSEGKAKKFSFYFLKWWLTRRILQVPRLYTWIIDETVFSAIWLRLLGAKIGSNFMVEQPYILEPDLVSVGDDCVVEFETQFSTSEIRNGCLELRKVQLGNKVKVGTRAVLLGGTFIHDGSEIKPKSTVDYFTSTIEACQILEGSPAIVKEETTNGKEWRPKSGYLYNLAQLFGCVALVEMMTVIGYVSASIGLVVQKRYGSIGLVIYLGSMFSIVSNLLFLLTAAMMKKFLFPFALIPFKEYRG
jgi:Acetyltransferase (isoleucine patch superfamily)